MTPPTTEATVAAPPDRKLHAKLASNFPLDLYTNVLDGLLAKLTADLHVMEASKRDTVPERNARRGIHDRLSDARERVIEAIGSLQRVRDPELRFTLGALNMSDGVVKLIGEQAVRNTVWSRHARGDWGAVEAACNEQALQDGGRLCSEHRLFGVDVVVITEPDRSATMVMLKDEY